jgi:Protein of unknown function (DUF3551)
MRALILSSGVLAATLMAAPQPVFSQAQGAFCLESPTGARNCIYSSIEQCQQALGGRSVGGGCVPNPAGTTGRGGMEAPRGSGPNSMDRQPLGGGGGQQRQ